MFDAPNVKGSVIGCLCFFLTFIEHKHSLFQPVGEEDEVSIRQAVEMIAEALEFKGQIEVSFKNS